MKQLLRKEQTPPPPRVPWRGCRLPLLPSYSISSWEIDSPEKEEKKVSRKWQPEEEVYSSGKKKHDETISRNWQTALH